MKMLSVAGPLEICLLGCTFLGSVACGSSDDSSPQKNLVANAGASTASGGAAATNGGAATTNGGAATTNGGAATTNGGAATTNGGAATTSAGSGNVAGAPTVVVKTDCSALPKAGTWENISPSAFLQPSNMETLSVVVNPTDHTVFAAAGNVTNGGMSGTGVYRSADCGATWVHVSTGTGSSELGTGDPWEMLIDPAAPQTMYMSNGYGSPPSMFKSTDGAMNWMELKPDKDNVLSEHIGFVQSIGMDAGNSQHLAVTFHDDCGAPYNKVCLSQTTDGGTTWQEFNGPSQLPGWQEGAGILVLGATSYLHFSQSGAYYTSDTGKTWSQVVTQGIRGAYVGPTGTIYLGIDSGPITVSKGGGTPSFTVITGSPVATVLLDDGSNMIVSNAFDSSGMPFYIADDSDTTKWTNMPSPTVKQGSNAMAYDSEHHVVYGAQWGAGLWRLVTQ